jgi:hypothetical protein
LHVNQYDYSANNEKWNMAHNLLAYIKMYTNHNKNMSSSLSGVTLTWNLVQKSPFDIYLKKDKTARKFISSNACFHKANWKVNI